VLLVLSLMNDIDSHLDPSIPALVVSLKLGKPLVEATNAAVFHDECHPERHVWHRSLGLNSLNEEEGPCGCCVRRKAGKHVGSNRGFAPARLQTETAVDRMEVISQSAHWLDVSCFTGHAAVHAFPFCCASAGKCPTKFVLSVSA